MRVVILMMLAASVAWAQPNSTCDSLTQSDQIEVWEVDTASVFPAGVTGQDALRMVDAALSRIQRLSRASFRHRVSASPQPCTGGASCVDFQAPPDDFCYGPVRGPCGALGWCGLWESCQSGMCVDTCDQSGINGCGPYEVCNSTTGSGICIPKTPAGGASCNIGFPCEIDICPNNIAATANVFIDPYFAQGTMAHELSHALGLAHVDQSDANSCVASPPSGVANCGDSVGCAGEMMCTNASCAVRGSPLSGDAEGLRNSYNGGPWNFTSRPVALAELGELPQASFDTPGFSAPYGTALHAPRMDCARTTTAVSQCASVRTIDAAGNAWAIRIGQLTGASTTVPTAFGTSNFIADISSSAHGSPDIALNADGSVAWVVWSNGGQVFIRRQVMVPGAVGTNATIEVTNGASFVSVVPPRIAYLDATGQLVVAIYGSQGSVGAWTRPRLTLLRYDDNPTLQPALISITGSDFPNEESPNNAFVGEFDLDCAGVFVNGKGPFYDRCVVVAPRQAIVSGALLQGQSGTCQRFETKVGS